MRQDYLDGLVSGVRILHGLTIKNMTDRGLSENEG
jgi:hypothetical protein